MMGNHLRLLLLGYCCCCCCCCWGILFTVAFISFLHPPFPRYRVSLKFDEFPFMLRYVSSTILHISSRPRMQLCLSPLLRTSSQNLRTRQSRSKNISSFILFMAAAGRCPWLALIPLLSKPFACLDICWPFAAILRAPPTLTLRFPITRWRPEKGRHHLLSLLLLSRLLLSCLRPGNHPPRTDTILIRASFLYTREIHL